MKKKLAKWLPVSNRVTLEHEQVKLLVGPLVIQLVWCLLKQLFTSALVKLVDVLVYLAASRLGKYPPLFSSTNNCFNYCGK